jgi:polypeptide N-acetylgalactosaminyltransferase
MKMKIVFLLFTFVSIQSAHQIEFKIKNEVDSEFYYGNYGTDIKLIGKRYFQEDFSQLETNPDDWPGENGKKVETDRLFEEEGVLKKHQTRFAENKFDVVTSELIALNRSVGDLRSQQCKDQKYPIELPKTSIIISYHNEAESTLKRTLISIMARSPLKFIEEIILVDDASINRSYLLGPLDDFVKSFEPIPVHIIRSKERIGLIKARMLGVRRAKGEVITFLDSHMEVFPGWLPPLLLEIKNNR